MCEFQNQTFCDIWENVQDSIPDGSIDLILTDPPYGVTASDWDENINLDYLWAFFRRIVKKNGVICLFSAQPFTTKLIQSNINEFKYCWYWKKNQATNFFHAKRMPLRIIEEICVFGGKTYYPQKIKNCVPTNSAVGCYNGNVYHGKNKRDYLGGNTERFPNHLLEFKCVNNYQRKHPNEKPVNLLEYLIKTYTQNGDVVLDCFAGSGSTGLACLNTQRNYVLIEQKPEYCKIINERLNKHLI